MQIRVLSSYRHIRGESVHMKLVRCSSSAMSEHLIRTNILFSCTTQSFYLIHGITMYARFYITFVPRNPDSDGLISDPSIRSFTSQPKLRKAYRPISGNTYRCFCLVAFSAWSKSIKIKERQHQRKSSSCLLVMAKYCFLQIQI